MEYFRTRVVQFGKSPFWNYGLPFTLMVLGSAYVLAKLRAEYYYTHDRSGRRLTNGSHMNSLERDIEKFEEKSRVVDEYEMKPI